MSPEQFVRLIDRTFCGQDAPYGPYHQLGGGDLQPPATLVPDRLYRFDLADRRGQAVSLQVFRGVNELGGMMWHQVVRVLVRAATSGHSSLPVIIDGGFIEPGPGQPAGDGFAFVLTEDVDTIIDQNEAAARHLAAHPMVALRQFHLVVDGLAALHRMGIIHRNIWPGSITVRGQPGDDSFVLGLGRFEMSTLVANMLGAGTLDVALARSTAQGLYTADARALPYMPPERVAALYGDGPAAFVETEFSDVYSLGVVAAEWFLGALPEVDASLPSEARTRAFREKLRHELAVSTLPIPLRDLLTTMTSIDPSSRLSAGEVVSEISNHFEAISALWDPANLGNRPFLLLVRTHEHVGKLCRDWRWIDGDPTVEEGEQELVAFIERDLTRGRFLHAPHGADPYLESSSADRKREAAHLIIGDRGAWFCRVYEQRSSFGGMRRLPQILEIRYVINLDSARGRAVLELEARSRNTRRTRAIEVIPATPTAPHAQELERMCEDRPTWQPVIEAVASKVTLSSSDMVASQALDWLLEYLGVELLAQEYAYETVPDSRNGDTVLLRWDREGELRRLSSHPMLAKYAADPQRRPDFADFFDAGRARDGETDEVEVVGRVGEPGFWRNHAERCTVLSPSPGQDQVRVRVRTSADIPPRGWLRPYGQVGTRMLLERQAEAKAELLDNRLLLRQLRQPSPILGRPIDVSDHTTDMIGDSPRVIEDMLRSDPFFALQGPPGTGKTEIAARAIALHLLRNRNHRILVSAQSNYALDNLAQRVLAKNGLLVDGAVVDDADNVALRISTSSGERRNKVDAQIQPFTLAELVVRRQQAMIRHAEHSARSPDHPAALRALFGEWRTVVEKAGPELSDRLHRGANIVFATCATATPRLLNAPTSTAAFDWVIVEEAAKAWPTELAIPLVRGVRWTLIGDHHQLGAHRQRETIAFLEECGQDDQPELSVYRDKVKDFAPYLMLFGGLFDVPAKKPNVRSGGGDEVARITTDRLLPVQSLRDQFRMRDPIAQLVSRVFYEQPPAPAAGADAPAGPEELPEGLLVTRREDGGHWATRIPWLADEALVWIDTSALTDCNDEAAWENPGEARLIARLLQRLGPPPQLGPDRSQLAVLTPYRQQLVRQLDGRSETRGYGHTIHAYQGREAEVVVVSLVRSTPRGDPGRPWMSLGHLVSEPLVNVMLSRARGLLVIVGNYTHFAHYGQETKWRQVCTAVRRFGRVIPAGWVYDS